MRITREKTSLTSPISRREFFAGVGMVAATGRSLVAQSRQTRLVLLGTGGGPRPRTANSGSAQVIVSNAVAYVIDCGDGVARQMAFCGRAARAARARARSA